jgi:hypothetical protein
VHAKTANPTPKLLVHEAREDSEEESDEKVRMNPKLLVHEEREEEEEEKVGIIIARGKIRRRRRMRRMRR